MSTPQPGAAPDALRAEHDELARRLEIRRSVDAVRRGLYQLFFGALSVGLGIKLAWDRWGTVKPGTLRRIPTGPPLFFWMAAAVAVVLLVLAVRSFLAARRLRADEEALWTRYRAVRAALGLDP